MGLDGRVRYPNILVVKTNRLTTMYRRAIAFNATILCRHSVRRILLIDEVCDKEIGEPFSGIRSVMLYEKVACKLMWVKEY